MKREVLEWAVKYIAGEYTHPELKKPIHVTKQGLKHCIYSKTGTIKLLLIPKIPELIKCAKLIATEQDKQKRPDILAVYKFRSTIRLEKNSPEMTVYIIVREYKNHALYYDHGEIKVKRH